MGKVSSLVGEQSTIQNTTGAELQIQLFDQKTGMWKMNAHSSPTLGGSAHLIEQEVSAAAP